jgi:hypothetical protein
MKSYPSIQRSTGMTFRGTQLDWSQVNLTDLMRKGGKPPVSFNCKRCNRHATKDFYYINKLIANGIEWQLCSSCSNSIASKLKWKQYTPEVKERIRVLSRKGVVDYCASLTPEERVERSRRAGKRNTNLSVIRQWETIKADPIKFAALKVKERTNYETYLG